MTLRLSINLSFDGQCEDAFKFYEQYLNGKITFKLTWGDSPIAAQAPPGREATIFHATLKIGDTVILGSDPAPDQYEQPKGFSIVTGE